MKSTPGTFILGLALVVVFAIELITQRMGNETALLGLGALPTDGHLNGEYWRIFTFSFLHLSWAHLLLNLALLYWVGRIFERHIGTIPTVLIFEVSCILSGVAILVAHSFSPTPGSAIGASGGDFGLLGAALILVYRRDAAVFGQDQGLRIGLWLCLAIGLAESVLPGVSIVGHLAGLLVGLPLGKFLKVNSNPANTA
jgi:rhomboid protease GluP